MSSLDGFARLGAEWRWASLYFPTYASLTPSGVPISDVNGTRSSDGEKSKMRHCCIDHWEKFTICADHLGVKLL